MKTLAGSWGEVWLSHLLCYQEPAHHGRRHADVDLPEPAKISGRIPEPLCQQALSAPDQKTLITHGRTGAARFLGYEITVQHSDSKITGRRRATKGKIRLRVPPDVIKTKCAPHLKHGKPAHRTPLTNAHDHPIVSTYGAQYRGIVGY